MPLKGSYLLVIRVSKSISISVGRLGEVPFKQGWYAYGGSAKKGVRTRVARHCRPGAKRLRWHIDYLLAAPEATVVEAWAFPGDRPTECDLVQALTGSMGCRAGPKGFGASDCRAGCGAHLVWCRKKPVVGGMFSDSIKL